MQTLLREIAFLLGEKSQETGEKIIFLSSGPLGGWGRSHEDIPDVASWVVQIQGRSPGGEIVGELRVLKDRVTQLPQTARCMSWVQCENFTEIWTQHSCTLAILEHIMRKWVRKRLEFPSVSQQTEISKHVHWDKWVHSISVKLFTLAAFRV